MPLTLNIHLSRKVGEANYGSRGATVGLELEVEASLVDEPQELHARIEHLFALAREAVTRELAEPTRPATPQGGGTPVALDRPPDTRPVTGNQLRAIQAIAARQQLDLGAELESRFGVDQAERLTLHQASQLIDALVAPVRWSTYGNGH